MNAIAQKVLDALDRAIAGPVENIATRKPAAASVPNTDSPAAPSGPLAALEAQYPAIQASERKKAPGRPHWQGQFLDLSKVVAAVTATEEIATAGELSQLGQLQNRWDTTYRLLESLSIDRVLRDAKEQARAIQEAIASGDAGKLSSISVFNRDELIEEAQTKRRAVKLALRKISDDARPIARAIMERLASAAQETVERLEEGEKARAFEFGVPFVPSLALQATSQLTWRCLELIDGSAGAVAPKEMIRYAGIVL